MAHLSLVKPLARLRDEQQQFVDEVILDAAGVTFERGSLAELSGTASCGKTSVTLALLAQLTANGEVCAAVDSCDSLDPVTAKKAGVVLDNLLWVRCGGRLEEAFLAADLLVQAKGFGAVWLNLNGLSENKLRQVPRTYWYRYRTRIKETPTIFVVTAAAPIAGSASQRPLGFTRENAVWTGNGSFKLLSGFHLKIQPNRNYYDPPSRTRAEVEYAEACDV